jgi:thioredoxin reductase (NADPH)
MPVLTTEASDAAEAAQALRMRDARLVVCFCAAWCDTCGEFRQTFERLAKADPDARYLWVDIEDDAAMIGDIDVENFPTLAVYRGGAPLFYGVTLPQEGVVARTLASVSSAARASSEIPPAVERFSQALLARAS